MRQSCADCKITPSAADAQTRGAPFPPVSEPRRAAPPSGSSAGSDPAAIRGPFRARLAYPGSVTPSLRPAPARPRRRALVAVIAAAAATALLAGCTGPAPAADGRSLVPGVGSGVSASPELAAVSPAAASVSGGDVLTLTGTALDEVDRVTVGGRDAADVTVVSATEVTAVAPRTAEYQPDSGEVIAWVGDEQVAAEAAPTVQYEVRTGIDRQLSYALKHWQREDYNLEEWGTLNPVGGDCANFVSQTLIQRGWEMTDDWFSYDQSTNRTGSWGYVPAMDAWLEANAEQYGLTKLSSEQRDQVKVGDIVMFDWERNGTNNHVQIVSDVVHEADGSISILMVGHNKDTDFRDFDETITVDWPGGAGYFWSIPEA